VVTELDRKGVGPPRLPVLQNPLRSISPPRATAFTNLLLSGRASRLPFLNLTHPSKHDRRRTHDSELTNGAQLVTGGENSTVFSVVD
jgi:hypothetical protein